MIEEMEDLEFGNKMRKHKRSITKNGGEGRKKGRSNRRKRRDLSQRIEVREEEGKKH